MKLAEAIAGQVALVTGANRGIGRQISLDLAAAGATVALSARDVDSLIPLQKQIEDAGGQYESAALRTNH